LLTETGGNPYQQAFFAELRRLGYTEGTNLLIERHSGQGLATEGLAELARSVAHQRPDVILTVSYFMADPLKAAGSTIPIVAVVNDPVGAGFADSLSRPGRNMTGVVVDAGMEVWEKRFQFLREIVPAAARIAFLATQPAWEHSYGVAVRQAAQKMSIPLTLAPFERPGMEEDYRRAFAALREKPVDGLVVNEGPSSLAWRQLVVDLADELRLPTMYPYRDFPAVGGLMSYGPDLRDLWTHAARQVDQVLKGAKAGEIPFAQATRFELVLNLKCAKALGIAVPPALLARADEVVE
jgi:putative ABC transport system substrate-binding protein